MTTRRQMLLFLLGVAGLSGASSSVSADSGKGGGGGKGGGHGGGDDDDDDRDDDDGYYKARDAAKNGSAASLQEILKIIRKKYAGRIVRVRLTGSGESLVYRIRILDSKNYLIEVRVNAVTRQIVSAQGV